MKKILFLLFVLISITAKGQQTLNNPVASVATGKSLVEQKMDSTCCNETANIKNHLTSFYKANRCSQLFIYGGSLITVAGALIMKNTDKGDLIPVFGGLCTIVGGIIYLDSFKFLNMNKSKKSKAQSSRSIDDLYW